MLQLNLLGQLRIIIVNDAPDDNESIELNSEKMVGLLAYLAVTGESFSRPQLEALLWGDSSAQKAQTSLRTAVYNLNKQLDNPLKTTRKTVTFAPKRPFTLDVDYFQELIHKNDTASLQTAVSLYRGDFLAGLTVGDAPEFEAWLLQERERLRLKLLSILEKLIERHSTNGHTVAAIQCARHLLQIEPWREAVHRHLMLLLARTGDYNAAIKQYQQCVTMLAIELDVPPMPETESLYQRIVALRQQPPKLHLPFTLTTLIGREPELAKLNQMLADPSCRLVVITGMGGMGKTSLAMALAQQQARHFLDGVFFVSLANLKNDSFLETAVIDAMQFKLPPQAEPLDYLCQQLQSQELLLILDNAERLLTAVSSLTNSLLQAVPALKIVITSREAPRLRAATRLPLAGLPLPKLEEIITSTPATRLFQRHARRIQHDFSNTEAWLQVVTLCHLVEGSPLGIELIAAQLEMTSCAELVTKLQRSMAELAVDFEDMPPRHRSLRAVFYHSWQLLTFTEQDALAKLTVFRGGFTRKSAYQVAQINKTTLRSLQAKSLLQQRNGRFVPHPLIRQFAREKLSAKTATWASHAHYFSQQLQSIAEGILTDQPAVLLVEIDNIRAMWQYAIDQQATSLLQDTTHGLARFYAVTNQFREGRLLFAQAVTALQNTAVSEAAPLMWGQLLGRYSLFLLQTGQIKEALRMSERSVTILRNVPDTDALAFSLNLLGISQLQSGAFETAVPLLNECADLYRHAENPGHLLKPLINLGSVQMRLGNYDATIAHLNEALPLAKQIGDKRAMTHIYNNLGVIHLILNNLEAAYQQFITCLPLTEETAYQPVRIVALQNLAEVCYKQGDWRQARQYCEASLAISVEIEAQVRALRTQKIYALTLYALGEQARAWQILYQAIEVGVESEALPTLMDVLTGVGQLLLTEEETAVSIDLLQFIYAHPATEKQHVQEVERMLIQADVKIERREGKRPLADVITAVLHQIKKVL